MCGSYRLTKRRILEIQDYYGIDDVRELDLWQREFNIPPTEVAPIIFDHKGSRHLVQAVWGLISPGTESREEAKKVSTFNARSETLMTKPTFTNAFLRRRCIVPAEAFYEWVGPKGGRQPLSIERGRWKASVNGGIVQLLETSSFQRAANADLYGYHDQAKSVDDTHSQPHACNLAGRSD
jgi:putative SOS response-associated peptidase YedK